MSPKKLIFIPIFALAFFGFFAFGAGHVFATISYHYDSQFGSEGSGDGQFNGPISIASDSIGDIYVADEGNDRIQKFNSSGQFQMTFGWGVLDGSNEFQICHSNCRAGITGSGDGQFNGILGVAIGPSNKIYVVEGDGSNQRVQIFNSIGEFQLKFGERGSGVGQFNTPWGIAVDSLGNIYVAEEVNNRIQKFNYNGSFNSMLGWGVSDGITEELQTCISNCHSGIPGSGNGQFDYPVGIAIDSLGNIYVTDINNDRVQVFNSLYQFQLKFGENGSGNGQFHFPSSVILDSSDNIYVADEGNYRIQIFNSNGEYQSQFGSNGSGDGQFNNPLSVSLNSQEDIYIVDQGNNRIQKFVLDTPPPAPHPRHYTTGSSISRMSQQQIAQIFGLPTPPSPQAPAGEAPQEEPKAPQCNITHTLKLNSIYKEEVKCLQEKLGITSDGIFGPHTKQAVIDFQKLHNLTPDGVVGGKTRKALFS